MNIKNNFNDPFVLCVCMYVHLHEFMGNVCTGWRAFNPLELELQAV